MGACSIGFSTDGTKTRDEVVNDFRDRQADDRDNYHDEDGGDGDGYTGDFQTVNRVDFRGKVFADHDEANEFCLDHAEKWSTVVAVKVENETENYWWVAGWGAE